MEEFVTLTKDLLQEEHQAEIEECGSLKKKLPLSELQNRGICIKKLHIFSMKTGLYGRTIVKLGLRGASDRPLPSHNFSSGDIVDLHLKAAENFSNPELQGVVMSVKETMIDVALDGEGSRSKADELLSSDQSMILFKTANEVTYRRLQKGLQDLMHHNGVASNLIDICFGIAAPTSYAQPVKVEKYYNNTLNDSQKEAIEFALSQKELAIIHGPPGTGKTTTVAELVAQFVSNGQKVLACAPSNVAIDNILEKLSVVTITRRNPLAGHESRMKLIRLGHPARIVTPELHSMSLDAMISKSDAAKIVQDVRKDIDSLYANLRKTRKKDINKFREERKTLTQELKQREKKAITEILTSADVILSTNVGAHLGGPLKHVPKEHFDVVVIDECGQALEASCWIPILQAPKVILAGDHLQLPPTVKSNTAAAKLLSKSLLERITKLHSQAVRMLTIQYRMNISIMKWSSDNLYESKLSAHESVKDHTLKDLCDVQEDENTATPMLLIDTAGCDMPELQNVDNDSIGNPGEAEIVAHHVTSLIDAGVNPKDIAVISPYNMQVDILRTLLYTKYKGLEIRSVDGFQGREKEAVVISLVRSNEKGIVGFLSDDRRTNVAVTRARRHLALVCDSLTIGKHKFLKTLIDYIGDNGEVRSAHDFTDSFNGKSDFHCDMASFSRAAQKISSKKPTHKRETENRVEKLGRLKAHFRKTIDEFMESAAKGGTSSHAFPSSLKAHERLAVHELGEELGLNHVSVGEGNERQIVISIKSNRTDEGPDLNTVQDTNNPKLDKSLEDAEHPSKILESKNVEDNSLKDTWDSPVETAGLQQGDPKENEEPEKPQCPPSLKGKQSTEAQEDPCEIRRDQKYEPTPDKNLQAETHLIPCRICGKKLLSSNVQLHQVHCERLQAMKEKLQPRTSQNSKAEKKAPKSKKKKSKKKLEDITVQDDDELLDDAIKANKLCQMMNCKKYVTVLGQHCPFCKKTFCFEHNMPERHGCGSAAHLEARRKVCRDGIMYNNGSGPSNHKLPPEKHAYLQRKLDGRLKEMEGKRKPNNKNEK